MYANHNVNGVGSAFSLIFSRFNASKNCTFTNIESNMKLSTTFLLISVYKSIGEPVHQLLSKDDERTIFTAIYARNRFQEV